MDGERHHKAEVQGTLQSAPEKRPLGLQGASAVATAEQGKLRWFPTELIPTPENPYDENAVEVRTQWGLVGYIDRDHAVDFDRLRPADQAQVRRSRGRRVRSAW